MARQAQTWRDGVAHSLSKGFRLLAQESQRLLELHEHPVLIAPVGQCDARMADGVMHHRPYTAANVGSTDTTFKHLKCTRAHLSVTGLDGESYMYIVQCIYNRKLYIYGGSYRFRQASCHLPCVCI